jgi:hypothetical protein
MFSRISLMWFVSLVATLGVATLSTGVSADVLNMGGTRNADGTWTGLASILTVYWS